MSKIGGTILGNITVIYSNTLKVPRYFLEIYFLDFGE